MAAVYTAMDAASGLTFPVRDDECLLVGMRRAGSGPKGCHGGGCGVCKVQVSEGGYEIFKRMSRAQVSEVEQAAGIVLACCVRPSSDITYRLL